MLALYLTTNENMNLPDFVAEDTDIILKKLVSIFALSQFIRTDIRNYDQATYILLDRAAIKEEDDELPKCLQSLQLISDARIILYYDGCDPANSVLAKLVDMGITNLVIDSDIAGIKEDLAECFSPQGLQEQKYRLLGRKAVAENTSNATDESVVDLFGESHNNIRVAIAGTQSRVGTTTFAIQFASYLAIAGAKVACINCAEQSYDLFSRMAKAYPVIDTDFGFTFRGIDFFCRGFQPPQDYHIIIQDMGQLPVGEALMQYLHADKRILCAGTRFDEMAALVSAMQKLKEVEVELVGVFTPHNAQEDIRNFVEQYGMKMSFAEFAPDLFDIKANADVFNGIVRELTEVQI